MTQEFYVLHKVNLLLPVVVQLYINFINAHAHRGKIYLKKID